MPLSLAIQIRFFFSITAVIAALSVAAILFPVRGYMAKLISLSQLSNAITFSIYGSSVLVAVIQGYFPPENVSWREIAFFIVPALSTIMSVGIWVFLMRIKRNGDESHD